MNFAFTDFYAFLRGPGFVISVLVFAAGFIYRSAVMIRATRKIRKQSFNLENYKWNGHVQTKGPLFHRIIFIFKNKIRNTIFGTNPVIGIISLIFHILLFITPVFLSAHNIIADLTIGLSLPALPEQLTDIFTILLLSMGGFFLSRRIFIPRVRIISTSRDYMILLFVMAPFFSGFLAYHQFFNYRAVIFTHMVIGEIAIMIIPFTSLAHMPFILFSRFYIDSEHNITAGRRTW